MNIVTNSSGNQIMRSAITAISSLEQMSKRCDAFATCSAQHEKYESKMRKIAKKLPACFENTSQYLNALIQKKKIADLSADELNAFNIFANVFEVLEKSFSYLFKSNSVFEKLHSSSLGFCKAKIQEIQTPLTLKRQREDMANEEVFKRQRIESETSQNQLQHMPWDIVKLICRQLGIGFWPLMQTNKYIRACFTSVLKNNDPFINTMEIVAKAARAFLKFTADPQGCDSTLPNEYHQDQIWGFHKDSIYPFFVKAMQPSALTFVMEETGHSLLFSKVRPECMSTAFVQHIYEFICKTLASSAGRDLLDAEGDSLFDVMSGPRNEIVDMDCEFALERSVGGSQLENVKWFIDSFKNSEPDLVLQLIKKVPFDLISGYELFALQSVFLTSLPCLDKANKASTVVLRMLQAMNQNPKYEFSNNDFWVEDPFPSCIETLAEGDIESALLVIHGLEGEYNRASAAGQIAPYAFSSSYIPNALLDMVQNQKKNGEGVSRMIRKLLKKLSQFEKEKICTFLPFIERILNTVRPHAALKTNSRIYVDELEHAKIMCSLFLVLMKINDKRANDVFHILVDFINESENNTESCDDQGDLQFGDLIQDAKDKIFRKVIPGLLKLYDIPYVINEFLVERPDLIYMTLKEVVQTAPLEALSWSFQCANLEAQEVLELAALACNHCTLPDYLVEQLYGFIVAINLEDDPIVDNYERPQNIDCLLKDLAPHMHGHQQKVAEKIGDPHVKALAMLDFFEKNKMELAVQYQQNKAGLIGYIASSDNWKEEYMIRLDCIFNLKSAEAAIIALIDRLNDNSKLWPAIEEAYHAFIKANNGNSTAILERIEGFMQSLDNSQPLKLQIITWLMRLEE